MGKFSLPVVVVTGLRVKYPVRIISGTSQIWLSRYCILKFGCECKKPALLLAVKIAADLGRIVATVGVLAGCFDVVNMEAFGDIS